MESINNTLDSFEIVASSCDVSEFSSYDTSVITDCIMENIGDSSDGIQQDKLLFSILEKFSEKYGEYNSEHVCKCENGYAIANPYKCLTDKYNELLLSSATADGFSTVLLNLIECYDTFIEAFECAKKSKTYSVDLLLAEKCVNAYYDLVRQTVFYTGNDNLHNFYFRNSDYLKDLVVPNRFQHRIINKAEPDIGFNVSFIDAYCLDTVLLIIKNTSLLQKSINNTTALKELKISLFCSMADRCFGRYVYLDGETYRITMNRQTSKIVARPFSNRSSLTSVKPIRLFEKIKSFLKGCFDDPSNTSDNQQVFTVSIVGHVEKSWLSFDPKEVEAIDLCLAVQKWIDSEYPSSKHRVQIDYYVNIADWYTCSGKRRYSQSDSKPLNNEFFNHGRCTGTIKQVSYSDLFCFTTEKIKSIINDSRITFFLDPAFLYNENYEIGESFPIEYYCSTLEKWDNEQRNKKINSTRIDSIERSSVVQTDMMFMNAQLNRFMASKSKEAGSICRVFRDSIIDAIKTAVKSKVENSVVYIFSSETIGLEKSSEASYPLARSERYNGKVVNIFQYSNYPVPRLQMEDIRNGDVQKPLVCFKIPFWSSVKYISLNYFYLYGKELIDASFKTEKIAFHDCLKIFKYIYTDITIKSNENGKYYIDYSVVLDSRIKCIFDQNNDLKKYQDFYEKIKGMIREMFENILFKTELDSRSNFGNELIKLGFCMNVYSSIKSVDGIYFWYNYRKACNENDFSKFVLTENSCEFDENVFSMEQNIVSSRSDRNGSVVCDDYFFMDKKIYAVLLEQLDQWGDTNFAFASMFSKWNNMLFHLKNYDDPACVIARALTQACERVGDTDTQLYNRIINWGNT